MKYVGMRTLTNYKGELINVTQDNYHQHNQTCVHVRPSSKYSQTAFIYKL